LSLELSRASYKKSTYCLPIVSEVFCLMLTFYDDPDDLVGVLTGEIGDSVDVLGGSCFFSGAVVSVLKVGWTYG